MTADALALVALLAANALPVSTEARIELEYSNDLAGYRRAVDVLDQLGMLNADDIRVRRCGSGDYELVTIAGSLVLSGPVKCLYATETLAAEEPILRLARIVTMPDIARAERLVQQHYDGMAARLPLSVIHSNRDFGDEHPEDAA